MPRDLKQLRSLVQQVVRFFLPKVPEIYQVLKYARVHPAGHCPPPPKKKRRKFLRTRLPCRWFSPRTVHRPLCSLPPVGGLPLAGTLSSRGRRLSPSPGTILKGRVAHWGVGSFFSPLDFPGKTGRSDTANQYRPTLRCVRKDTGRSREREKERESLPKMQCSASYTVSPSYYFRSRKRALEKRPHPPLRELNALRRVLRYTEVAHFRWRSVF